MILPNCGMVFSGNMAEMMKGRETMEVSEMVSANMTTLYYESLQNRYHNCCSDATHNSNLARDTSLTNATKDVASGAAHIATTVLREEFISKGKKNVSIIYRQNAPPDPSEYCSLIGYCLKKLN